MGVAFALHTHTHARTHARTHTHTRARLGADPAHLTGQVLDGEDTYTWIYIYARGDICFLRGGQCCVYRKATKEQCDVLSVDEADIQLYLDLEAIECDSPVYMKGPTRVTRTVRYEMEYTSEYLWIPMNFLGYLTR